jgi:phage antirepressor YoqD-like protein
MNQIFDYEGNKITFQFGNGDVMVNATQMSRAFGKRPSKWLELPSTCEFLNRLRAIRKSDRLVVTQNGIGTWIHEDVALEFARWLSLDFAIWCNSRIKELLQHGFTATQDKLDQLINNPDLLISLASQLKQERADNQLLISKNIQMADTLQRQQPRVRFSEAVESSHTSVLVGDLAKILCQRGINIGQNRLFKFLRSKGYLCTKGDYYNTPSQKAMQMGLFEIKKNLIIKPNGTTLVTTTPMVTGRGQVYFVNKMIEELKYCSLR